jgi:hypothetical protein
VRKIKYLFFAFLILVLSCGEKAITLTHVYGKVTVLHPPDSIPMSGANVQITYDSTLIFQGLTDINGEFEFQMDAPTDTTVDVYSLYGYLGNEYLATTIMILHPGDTTEAIIFGY